MTAINTTSDAVTLRYRVATPNDVPALLTLWTEHSGWGPITETQWRSWYDDAPYGPAFVVLGEQDAGAPVGMTVFTPCRLWVAGREVGAVRVSAPVLSQTLRSNFMRAGNHPAAALYAAGCRIAASRGFAVAYSMPDANWITYVARSAGVVSHAPRHHAKLPCLTLDLSATSRRPQNTQVSIERVTQFGVEYDSLWQSACKWLPIRCGVVRSPQWMQYRHGGDVVLAARNLDGALIGTLAVSKRTGGVSNLLSATPSDLAPILDSAINWLVDARDADGASLPPTLSAVEVPATRESLLAAGFTISTFQFGLLADSLDEAVIPLSSLAPSEWYLLTGD